MNLYRGQQLATPPSSIHNILAFAHKDLCVVFAQNETKTFGLMVLHFWLHFAQFARFSVLSTQTQMLLKNRQNQHKKQIQIERWISDKNPEWMWLRITFFPYLIPERTSSGVE